MKTKTKEFLNSLSGAIAIIILLIVAVTLAMVQYSIWYFILILDALFALGMSKVVRRIYKGERTKNNKFVAIAFLALIPTTLVSIWNILIIFFVIIPIIASPRLLKSKRGI